jgi:hypothetical protein
MVASLFMGWIPAGFTCLVVYGVVPWRVSRLRKTTTGA